MSHIEGPKIFEKWSSQCPRPQSTGTVTPNQQFKKLEAANVSCRPQWSLCAPALICLDVSEPSSHWWATDGNERLTSTVCPNFLSSWSNVIWQCIVKEIHTFKTLTRKTKYYGIHGVTCMVQYTETISQWSWQFKYELNQLRHSMLATYHFAEGGNPDKTPLPFAVTGTQPQQPTNCPAPKPWSRHTHTIFGTCFAFCKPAQGLLPPEAVQTINLH